MTVSTRIGEVVRLDETCGVVLADLAGEELLVATAAGRTGSYTIALTPDDLQDGALAALCLIDVAALRSVPREAVCLGRLKKQKVEELLKGWSRILCSSYYHGVHAGGAGFVAGESKVAYAGRVYDESELTTLVDSSLDFWLTSGPYADRFEKNLAAYLGVRHCSLVNSGSSANLLAFMALTSGQLGSRRILPGDEVITVAAAFPTTVAPIVQYGAVPVFVDVSLPTYNIDCALLERALSPRTKAVFLAHTLGNPFDLEKVREFCDRHGLWLLEDNCDALGSRYLYRGEWRYTGSVGHIGTSSFYPPHHITLGEGGAVYTDDPLLKRLVDSFRDWGRDCWCASGRDDTCSHRFTQQFGELPLGYDHKYVYSHFGYNMKATDLQAAVGCAQLEKLPGFCTARRQNWLALKDGLADLEDLFILPEATEHADPSWFGFLLTVRVGASVSRDQMVQRLEAARVQTRMLFAGNIVKHPCFDEMRASGSGYRVVGSLENTDLIMERTFWLGVYPGMTAEMLAYMIDCVHRAAER